MRASLHIGHKNGSVNMSKTSMKKQSKGAYIQNDIVKINGKEVKKEYIRFLLSLCMYALLLL
jgi:hypothetical protein